MGPDTRGAALAGCSSRYASDNCYDPQDYEHRPAVEPPTQAEIDAAFERGLDDAVAKLRKSGRLRNTTCVDVTSYDNDWSNDMRCTRPNGTVFYTDYAGAAEAQDPGHAYDPDAACRDDGTKTDRDFARAMRELGLCDD